MLLPSAGVATPESDHVMALRLNKPTAGGKRPWNILGASSG